MVQEGAQRIIGFEFRASLMMDMLEGGVDTDSAPIGGDSTFQSSNVRDARKESNESKQQVLGFQLVESTMFSEFKGTWTLRNMSEGPLGGVMNKWSGPRTLLTYSVYIKPKGVPTTISSILFPSFSLLSTR